MLHTTKAMLQCVLGYLNIQSRLASTYGSRPSPLLLVRQGRNGAQYIRS